METDTAQAHATPEPEAAAVGSAVADATSAESSGFPCAPRPPTAKSREYGALGLWMLRGLVLAGTLVVAGQGIQRMATLAEQPMRWAKVLGPHRFATLTSFSLVALALVLAVFSGPIVRGSAWIWNAVTRRVRPATRADEVILLLGAMLILFQASLLFEILGGF